MQEEQAQLQEILPNRIQSVGASVPAHFHIWPTSWREVPCRRKVVSQKKKKSPIGGPRSPGAPFPFSFFLFSACQIKWLILFVSQKMAYFIPF